MRKNKKKGTLRGIRHVLAAVLFCMVMSIGIVSLADEQGTVTVASAKIRASADISSEPLGSVKQGGTVDIIGKTTGTDGKDWYQVYVDANTKGFIRGDLVKVADKSKIKTIQVSDAPAQNTDTTPTTATAVDAKKATVINNNVRIREGASTNHGVVATANKGMVLTVTGETDGSDGKKWYQISFKYGNEEKTGFIRSDLVTFENVPPDVAESQITGEENQGEEQPPQETVPAEEPPQDTPSADDSANQKGFTPMQAEPLEYVLPGFRSVQPSDNGQTYQAYLNGEEGKEQFYIIYGQKGDGETGWFLFDKERGVYIRYPYLVDGVKASDGITVGIIPVIVLVIIVVILAAVAGLLFLKLRENTVYGRGYGRDNDDDYGDDDIEDLEELEDDEDEDLPAGHPQGRPMRRPQPQGQPQRRPQPQGQSPSGQPQRRPPQPQGQSPSGQPQRRPQPQGQSPSGQPQRRPQPQGGNPQSGARPQGGRPANGQQNPQRRPQPQGGNPPGRQPQNEKAPVQKGYKAKNLLEDDDDMDFMDI
ncbi:MAG: SH3 domain-containing protein [Lachnospiraceae bacterium]|nr:SH3 domain-containing protein [Lachnospiraceae bacterium]